jgi:hypothetical protein
MRVKAISYLVAQLVGFYHLPIRCDCLEKEYDRRSFVPPSVLYCSLLSTDILRMKEWNGGIGT